MDQGDVTLERINGKRTAIEFSVLRKEYQNYADTQIDFETKTPKDDKPKD